MKFSRRRVAFRPALETLSVRITPSDLSLCMPISMPVGTMSMTSDSTTSLDNVPPMYPPYGTPGTTASDYV